MPRNIDAFTHVVLLDGALVGHWRVVRNRTELSVETRVRKRLGRAEREALSAAVDRYRRFAGD